MGKGDLSGLFIQDIGLIETVKGLEFTFLFGEFDGEITSLNWGQFLLGNLLKLGYVVYLQVVSIELNSQKIFVGLIDFVDEVF